MDLIKTYVVQKFIEMLSHSTCIATTTLEQTGSVMAMNVFKSLFQTIRDIPQGVWVNFQSRVATLAYLPLFGVITM